MSRNPVPPRTLKEDTERLREWSRLIHVHGHDISEWGAAPFVAGEMERIASRLDALLTLPRVQEPAQTTEDNADVALRPSERNQRW